MNDTESGAQRQSEDRDADPSTKSLAAVLASDRAAFRRDTVGAGGTVIAAIQAQTEALGRSQPSGANAPPPTLPPNDRHQDTGARTKAMAGDGFGDRVSGRLGLWLSGLWVAVCLGAVALMPGGPLAPFQSVTSLGATVAGILTPLILLWVLLDRGHRAERLRAATEPLRSDIARLTTPESGAEERWRGVLGAVRQEVDELAATAERAAGRLSLVQREVVREIERVNNATDRARSGLQTFHETFRQSADQFTPIVFQVAESVEGLEQRLSAGVQQLSDDAETTRARLGSTIEALQTESGALAGAVRDIESQVKTISDTIFGQGEILAERVQAAFDGLQDVSDTIGRSVDRLEGVSRTSVAQQDEILSTLGDQTGALEHAGRTLLTRLDGVSVTLREAMTLATQAEDGTVEQARDMAAALRSEVEALTEASGRFTDLQSLLAGQAKVIGDVTQQTTAPLGALQAAIGSLQQAGDSLSTVAAGLSDQLDGSIARMAEGRTAMTATLDRTNGVADSLDQVVRDGALRLSTLAEDLSDRTESLASLIGDREASLRDTLSASEERSQALVQAFREETERLQTIQAGSEAASDRVRALAGDMHDRLHGLVDVAEGLSGRFTGLPEAIEGAARELESRAGAAIAGVEASNQSLQSNSDRILEAVTAAAVSGERWAHASESLVGQLQSAQANLDESSRHMAALVDRGSVEADRLQSAVGQGTTALTEVASDLFAKVGEVTLAYDQRVSAILRATALATVRANEIKAAFEREAADIGEINQLAEDATVRLVGLQDGLRRQTEGLIGQAESLNARLAGLPTVVEETLATLQRRSDATVGRVQGTSQSMVDVLGQLLDRVDGAMARGDRLTADIETRSGRFSDASDGALDRLAVLASQFHQRLAAFQDTVQETVESISVAGETVGQRITELDDRMTRVDGKAERTRQSVTAITGEIGQWMESTSQRLTAAGARLRDEMVTMAATARDARESLSRPIEAPPLARTATHGDGGRPSLAVRADTGDGAANGGFIASSRPVLEGLHLLSVDIDRLLDEDIPAATWKAFHAGDVSAFTRRLAARRDRLPIEEIAGRYTDDDGFRDHVDHYVGSFERLVADALRHDSGDLLSGSMITSDIGKVYLLLCTALDREPMAIGAA